MDGIYVVGWARKASEGLVGIARHDGEVGAVEVLKYLESAPDGGPPMFDRVLHKLEGKGLRRSPSRMVELLQRAEEQEAKQRGLSWFKYSDDEAMLAAIEELKVKS